MDIVIHYLIIYRKQKTLKNLRQPDRTRFLWQYTLFQ